MHRGRHRTIRDPDSRERWAAGGGMCHRQEGHEAAIGEISPTKVAFVAITHAVAEFVQKQSHRIFLILQLSQAGKVGL